MWLVAGGRRGRPATLLIRSCDRRADRAAVIMRGELTAAARREFDPQVTQLLAAAPSAVTVDMRDVTYIDSSWIEVLMNCGRESVVKARPVSGSRQRRPRPDRCWSSAAWRRKLSCPCRRRRLRSRSGAGVGTAREHDRPCERDGTAESSRAADDPTGDNASRRSSRRHRREPPSRPGPSVAGAASFGRRQGEAAADDEDVVQGPHRPPEVVPSGRRRHIRGRTHCARPPAWTPADRLERASQPRRGANARAGIRQRDATGLHASDRDAFMRNCVTAGQATAPRTGRASAVTTAAASELCIGPHEPDSPSHRHGFEDTAASDHRTAHVGGQRKPPGRRLAGLGSRPRFPPRRRRAGQYNCRSDHHSCSHNHDRDVTTATGRPQPRRPQAAQHRPRAQKGAPEHGKGHKKGPGRGLSSPIC